MKTGTVLLRMFTMELLALLIIVSAVSVLLNTRTGKKNNAAMATTIQSKILK